MSKILILLFLFSCGCLVGWCLELFYRRFFTKNRLTHKWINPGFLIGPCLPLYGTGLSILYLLASIPLPIANPYLKSIVLILIMGIGMTVVEYITGIIFIVHMHVKLWDYTNEWGNIQGVICPRFSFFWTVLGAFYYLVLHPHILDALDWLSRNLTFSFFIGFFYGIFMIDLTVSFNLMVKIKKLADEYEVIVHLSELREKLLDLSENAREKRILFFTSIANTNHTRLAFLHHREEFAVSRVRNAIRNAKEKLRNE